MEIIFESNTPLLFAIALFYAAVGGFALDLRARISLIYAFTCLVTMFQIIDIVPVSIGSAVVIFLMFEVFNQDTDLIRKFFFHYKIIDFLYRFFIEYYGWLFGVLLMLLSYGHNIYGGTIVYYCSGTIAILALAVLVTRAKYSTKPISEIINNLTSEPILESISTLKEQKEKCYILLALEDQKFFQRKEHQHAITISQVARTLQSKLSLDKLKHPISHSKSLFSRGYSTIEMQLIRTVGIELGSYGCVCRRKIFEILYSNMILNCYMYQFKKSSEERKGIRYWILSNYIRKVSVKFGERIIYPSEYSTLQILFNRPLETVSNEEFFVWCLGLPYYECGIGENALEIHKDIVEEFNLDIEALRQAINIAMKGDDRT